ncbi:carboxymuconolactone decarboxylase family protein [Aeromonas veronii]|uniref:carboxymuconolactone decarboxylase family protein n=1 Tax=Aeromonas veronii TaxID=654 RepID=UPI001932FC9D|nr:carboxymuconolactone decarboxylase family protein [Aeromonas veronii]MBM0418584.1 carboxymuconolactone decarboxylase family protein [Aeromonas veronii]MBW3790569.1 carboxymuconolactone decarboxylase family protein [Aeromonas veronii]
MAHPSLNPDDLALIAPKLSQLAKEVLFGDIWQRPALSARERSLITLAILASLGRVQQLPWHIAFAQQNGLTREQLEELFTHLAFYAGLPAAVTAVSYLPAREDVAS